MAIRALDRLLLVPAIIVLTSATLAGCALLPGGNPAPSASSSSESTDESGENDDDNDGASAGSNCPEAFDEQAGGAAGFDGTYAEISADEFSAPEVGTEYLEDGCIFRVTVDSEGTKAESDFAYIPGDADTVAAISANLEAEGFTKLTEGMYTLNDNFGVFVINSSDSMSATDVEKLELGFGDSFIIVMATSSGGARE